MSDVGSEAPKGSEPTFVESDGGKTRLPYDNGGLPFYVALAWVAFIVAYFVGVMTLVLPDLRAWMAH